MVRSVPLARHHILVPPVAAIRGAQSEANAKEFLMGKQHSAAVLIAILLLTPMHGPEAESSIDVTVEELGFGVSLPTAINNAGFIGGSADEDAQATILTPQRQILRLGVDGDVMAISDSGIAAVAVLLPAGQHCMRWTERHGLVDLTPNLILFDELCLPRAVNNSGDVVGFINIQPYFWDADGQATAIAGLDVSITGMEFGYSEVYDLNEKGTVVGYSQTENGVRAFAWTEAGGSRPLGFPKIGQWSHSIASAINNAGDIAGSITGVGSLIAIWKRNGDIFTVNAPPSAQVMDINDSGWVLFNRDVPDRSPSVWIPGIGVFDVGELSGTTNARAEKMNNRGMIVGGDAGVRGFLWTLTR